jgi:ABC-type dipeptide/oligopeptide/nickel transport system permease component
MGLIILKRLGETLIVLLIVTLMVFTLARLTGDPTPLVVPAEATEADRTFFREQYGLDKPLPIQYSIFLRNVVKGDFGISFRYQEPAINLVVGAIGPTLKLTGLSMLIAILIGLPLGILGAVFQQGWGARLINLYASFGQAIPSFWLGLMLILVFAINLGWLPSSGYGSTANYVLPAVTLAFYTSASILRLTTANMQEALKSDFVHMERVLGLSEINILLKHALRNASLPIVTYLGLQFGLLLGGAIVTERVFAWPGIGQTIVEAILSRDYPVIQATVLITAVMIMLINFAVDMLYLVLDPRVRS